MSKHALQRKNSGAPVIPDKLYFRIGEVAKLCGVEAYVLRFWESEFPQLRPNKSGTGQRLYRKRDVELALRIRQLLHQEGYTIAGARQVFTQAAQSAREDKKASPQTELALPQDGAARVTATQAKLRQLRSELRDLLGMLSSPPVVSQSPVRRMSKPRAIRTERPNLFE
ncbi:MerR family transcriptional regulator [Paracidobacterium acidisoli]|uniref:MerR family transcriptional regulator n=1 Tax=Paracidobacterium acidisoli TaxID=2303751 RepID=A0A372INE9_9BACT|nr:MerR family transcriptional regulator [Paracidobacterium acidisoli]MBT9332086.1 MerR family transcriptional regulator [Paracidobacterium acidisoli]